MLFIEAKKFYFQQKIKPFTKATQSTIILVKVNHIQIYQLNFLTLMMEFYGFSSMACMMTKFKEKQE